MEEHIEWWNMHSPDYDEERATRLINLLHKEIRRAQDDLGKLNLDEASLEKTTQGFLYNDGVQLLLYRSDFEDKEIYDAVYQLTGPSFDLLLRQTLAKNRECSNSDSHSWWLDEVYGDSAAVAWLSNPPKRTKIEST